MGNHTELSQGLIVFSYLYPKGTQLHLSLWWSRARKLGLPLGRKPSQRGDLKAFTLLPLIDTALPISITTLGARVCTGRTLFPDILVTADLYI